VVKLFKNALREVLFLVIFLSLFSVECWADVEEIKKEVVWVYKFVEKFGEYESEIEMRCVHKYNEKGNNVQSTRYNSEGNLESKHVSKYDKKGNEIERVCYNSEGNLWSKWIYKYDEKGNKVQTAEYDPGGNLKSKAIYNLDSAKQIKKIVS